MSAPLTALATPKPQNTGIKHVIVLMMENRSFDHMLGWLPGADGRQERLFYPDRSGVLVPTYPLAPDYQGCGHPDPDHSWTGGRVEFDNGACDGWLLAGNNDAYAIGYYTEPDVRFLGAAAQAWTSFDRYFASIMAETFPNRFYQHCAVTDRLDNSTTPSRLPTIWDRLAERGLDGRYYFSDLSFLGLWGNKYVPIMRSYAQFLADCASGDLPHVAFVEPRFIGELEGVSNDDHPHADIRAGEWFMAQTYRAVINSPAWRHPDFELLGFRVPAILISPFARRRHVSSQTYDHTSILKLIEWRWNLPALSVRDANANNLADELDFSTKPDLSAPDFAVPQVISGLPCTA